MKWIGTNADGSMRVWDPEENKLWVELLSIFTSFIGGLINKTRRKNDKK